MSDAHAGEHTGRVDRVKYRDGRPRYMAYCRGCAWTGLDRDTVDEARADAAEHEAAQ